jgi:amidophosphoribosyltransferase
MTRNHYVGRTFIEPAQSIRDFGVKIKLNPARRVIEGKSVVVVDDSIVRGTTMKKIIRMVRQAGATAVHVRVSSPPITHSCYYGIDTPDRDKLIAAYQPVESIRAFLDCDSLGYLSREGLAKCLAAEADDYCYACFTGDYPVAVPTDAPRRQLTLFEELKGNGG